MRKLFMVAGFACTAIGVFGSLASEESAPVTSVPAPVDYVVPVDCPQEDTCRMDYRGDGTWVLIYGETYTPEKVWSTGPLPVTCPQEDDCGLDYRGDLHRWVITENAPH